MGCTLKRLLFATCCVTSLAHCKRAPTPEQSAQSLSAPAAPARGDKAAVSAVLDLATAYPITEAIGAKKKVRMDEASAAEAHSPPDAWKIQLEKGAGFGGVCWKNRAGNEGEAPGDDLSKAGYRRIAFWAKGENGGEVAEFRAGGLGNIKTRHRDSFDVTAGKIKLNPGWSEYSIYVNDADLSSVMTPFCVLLHHEDNREGAVVYLDDLQYRG